MQLAVVGATGRSGRQVVAQALAAGHHVTAFAPDPSRLSVRHERLTTAPGDVLDQTAVKEAIVGADAVISTLGVKKRTTTTVLSEGMHNIVRAMNSTGTRRLVALSSASLTAGPHLGLIRRLYAEFIVDRVMRNVFLDLARMEDELAVSDLDYHIVRAGKLTDDPRTGRYRTATGSHLRRPGQLSRADLADYIIIHLSDAATVRTTAEVAY